LQLCYYTFAYGWHDRLNHEYRKAYEVSSTRFGVYCRKVGLTPNVLTGVSLLCAIGSGYFFWSGDLIKGVIFILLTSLTDMLDGATARAGNMGTTFGGILDHVSDRYGEFFILCGIGLSGHVYSGWAMFALFGMLIASYTRAAAESIGKISNAAVGWMGRLEKFVLIIVGTLLEYFYPGYNFLAYALIIVGVTSVVTSIQRLIFARRQLQKLN
jgi:phosphatidylglycerophosphate synthase